MRNFIAAVLAVAVPTSLFAAVPRGAIALGVGASSASEVVVKIDGKDAHVKLAGVSPEGTYAAQAFLQCLLAERVVRVDRAAGRVTMLDGTSVADHLAEFLQTRTQSDPCALGKAAYVPTTPRVAAAAAAAPAAPAARAATTPGKAQREVHVSFASGSAAMPSVGPAPTPQTSQSTAPRAAGPSAPAARPAAQPGRPGIYQPPIMSTYTPPPASTTTVPTVGTQTVGSAPTYTPPTTSTVAPPVAPTVGPATTTNPPL